MNMPSLGDLPIDLPRLLETRMLVQSNSGGGKSRTLRRLLEQTAGQVQQLIIDPEGEFATLRERFDYIICAPAGADAVATPQTAAALARALWQAGTSAILDIYELKAHERVVFVRRFLESLVNAPRSIWHPTLVMLDEAHVFAPQTGQCESTSAVIDVASRGRKRGLSLLAATQRLSKLNKDVAAELLNKLIGRTGLDLDVQRAADELGMAKRDALEQLRNLEPGEFFAFGPALSRTVVRTTIGDVVTTHPETGRRAISAPPPASPRVLQQLAKLEGIQKEAEAEQHTVEDLRAELAKVRRQLTLAEKAAPGVTEAEIKRRIDEAVRTAVAASLPAGESEAIAAERKASQRELEKLTVPLAKIRDIALQALGEGLVAMLRDPAPAPTTSQRGARLAPAARQRDPSLAPAPHQREADVPRREGISAPEQRIIDAIAWWHAACVTAPARHQVAFVAGYTVNGHFNNQCGTLRGRGLIDYPAGNCLGLTETGTAVANAPDSAPTREQLIERVRGILKGEPMRRIFDVLVEAGDEALTREECARRAGYTVNGHFNNQVGALNSIGVAEYPARGTVGLSKVITTLKSSASTGLPR